MSNPIRILHVLHGMDCGGAENMIMNLYRNIDRNDVQFDFLVHTDKPCFFDEEIIRLGGRIYHVTYYNVLNHLLYKSELKKFFRNHEEIKIVHGHLGSCAHVYLEVAKSAGCFTIAHSHNTLPTNKSIKNLLYRLFTLKTRKIAHHFIACGKQAGIDRFGIKIVDSKNFSILNNAIETQKYVYDEILRNKIRKNLAISGKLVVGHIGRFSYQKNHIFLMDIFYEIQKIVPESILMLVGDGDLRPVINDKIRELHIEDKVILTGVRNDVPSLLQAMDCFIFPSRYEGLPVTLVEAQAACLPIVCSSSITDEIRITNNIEFVSIEVEPKCWAEIILKKLSDSCRVDNSEKIIAHGYDIAKTSEWLANFYKNKYDER